MPDKEYIPQAGAIPYRIGAGGRVEVLLIRWRTGKKWVIPKGIVEHHQTHREAAVMETMEEAGAEGRLLDEPLGCYTHKKFGGTCQVRVFAMKVTALKESYLERAERVRQWFAADEAADTVGRKAVGKMIRKLAGKVGRVS